MKDEGVWFEGVPGMTAVAPAYRELTDRVAAVMADLTALEQAVPGKVHPAARALRERFEERSPVVTLVGQVKAGKTALSNALIGRADLLPCDVNPWTTVVTSVHLNSRVQTSDRSDFRFFDLDEWNALQEGGGRIGEIARRGNLEDKQEEIRAQLVEMQEKARARLGSNFELLVGSQHSFDKVTPELVEKYVCLGDETAVDAAGRYADMTKSADLYLTSPAHGVPVTFRDTPGVNDPFLVREQITVRTLRHVDVCLVVLSAHQALTSTDLALMRILGTLRREQIALFVNRIDELQDPANQMREIEGRIRQTLTLQGIFQDVPILFGSAAWALASMRDGPRPEGERASLERFTGRDLPEDPAAVRAAALEHSGLPALNATLAELLGAGPFARIARDVSAEGMTLAQQAHLSAVSRRDAAPSISRDDLFDRLDTLVGTALADAAADMQAAEDGLRAGLASAAVDFRDRKCAALAEELARSGRFNGWRVDSTELRQMLKDVYFSGTDAYRTQLAERMDALGAHLAPFYSEVFAGTDTRIEIPRPAMPLASAPVALSGTLAIDMEGRWWGRWFGLRRAPEEHVHALGQLIRAETDDLTAKLDADHIQDFLAECRATLRRFLLDQATALYTGLLAREAGTDGDGESAAHAEALEAVMARLSRHLPKTDAVDEVSQ
ncbi:MAG: dynamin family protein [Pseudomonadota bacterium]